MFWLIVALLCVVAVAFVAFPLIRRTGIAGPEHQALTAAVLASRRRELEQDHADGLIDDEQFQQAQAELAREARETQRPACAGHRAGRSAVTAAVLAAAIPALALAVYQQVGTPEAPTLPAGQMVMPQDDFTDLIAGLQRRLENNPDDPEGWMLLARSLYSTGQPAEALRAFRRAIDSGVENAAMYAQYADLLASERRSLLGEPERLIRKALELEPDNAHALWLAASAAQENGDLNTALRHWERLHGVLDPASEDAAIVAENLRAVRAQLSTGR